MEATNHSELWRIRFVGTEGALLHRYSKAPQKVHARFSVPSALFAKMTFQSSR